MLYELLKKEKAVGRENAIPLERCAILLKTAPRNVKHFCASERADGKLICSSLSKPNGYFLPATFAEVEGQKRRLEKGFVSRANAVRVFRQAVKRAKDAMGVEPCAEPTNS